MKKQTHYDVLAHVIHWLFALAIIFQLLSAQWMHHKIKPGVEPWTLKLFLFHEIFGVTVFFLLLGYLLRAASLVEKDKFGHLFPYNKKGFSLVIDDVKLLCRCRLPDRDFGGLAGLIQGLGFLLLLLVAFLGTLWLVIPANYIGASLLHDIKELHEFFAQIVWYYLAGHVGMFIIHVIVDRISKNKKV
ncbi:cytochrome b/b6 domain-containing protein [Cysteiniphilum sp. 6C5]|uniref:cytochrome b/b6 domain-containing protein n=1 Tax=unclassified Cysteiniphilum TaxID=2610889 RepID=UPI003F878032